MGVSPIIAIDKLRIVVEQQIVLDEFSMRIATGQKVAISGPSGCGKSTLLKSLLGLVHPVSGTISLWDQMLDTKTVWSLRQRIAYVAQEPDLGTGLVREILEAPFSYQANRTEQGKLKRLSKYLDELELPRSIVEKRVMDLSGGERQRLALVSALLLDRPLMLLDEVTAALDENRRSIVIDWVQHMDKTIVLVTHAPELFTFADQTIALKMAAKQGGKA